MPAGARGTAGSEEASLAREAQPMAGGQTGVRSVSGGGGGRRGAMRRGDGQGDARCGGGGGGWCGARRRLVRSTAEHGCGCGARRGTAGRSRSAARGFTWVECVAVVRPLSLV
ncbi:hypothetical protein DAI22_11g094350 [Oryza sativa Japonica Group]|nr:hypothetical protein DAI22_11g094350 [Oryza sativa Japonica Group]